MYKSVGVIFSSSLLSGWLTSEPSNNGEWTETFGISSITGTHGHIGTQIASTQNIVRFATPLVAHSLWNI